METLLRNRGNLTLSFLSLYTLPKLGFSLCSCLLMQTLAKRKIGHNKSLGWAPSFILPTWQMVTGTRCWGHRTRLELHGTDTINQVINYKQTFVSSIISCTCYKRKLAWPGLKPWGAFRVQMTFPQETPPVSSSHPPTSQSRLWTGIHPTPVSILK